MASPALILILLTALTLTSNVSTKKVTECEVVKEMRKAGIPSCLHGHFLCLIKHTSKFETSLETGPLCKASYSHGIFQIDSCTWCSRYRKDGKCNIKCDKLTDPNITDDVECAKKILDTAGLKYWTKWEKNCKGTTPPIPNCGKAADDEIGDERIDEELMMTFQGVDKEELTTFTGDDDVSHEELMSFNSEDKTYEDMMMGDVCSLPGESGKYDMCKYKCVGDTP